MSGRARDEDFTRFEDRERSYGYQRKRRTMDETEDVSSPKYIEKIIQNVGEKTDEDFVIIADMLLFEFSHFREQILDALEICISEFPSKTLVYIRLIDALNRRNPEFVQELLMNLVELIEIRFRRSDFDQVLLILKFFCITTSAGIISFSSFLEIFEQFMTFAKDGGNQQKLLILSLLFPCFPYLVKEMQLKVPSFIEQFLVTCQSWMELVADKEVKLISNEISYMNIILAYWKSIEELKQNDWCFTNDIEIKRDEPVAEHDLRTLKIINSSENFNVITARKVVLMNLPLNTAECPLPLFDILGINESVRVTMAFFQLNPIRGLQTICNQIRDSSMGRKVCFSFFSNMISLHLEAKSYFLLSATLINFCRLMPSIAPFIGRFIRYFYTNCESIDGHVLFLFYEWFALHLVNFDLKWNWEEWMDALEYPSNISPKRLFIEEIMDRLSRHLFIGRIKDALPSAFGDIVTEFCSKNCNEELKNNAEIQSYVKEIRSKKKISDIFPESPISSVLMVKFMQALLVAGAATFSHSVAFLEMYKDSLSQFARDDEQGAIILVREVFHFWKGNVQFFELVIQKLILYKILRPSQFVLAYTQLFSIQDLLHFKKWNILFIISTLITLRIEQCIERINELKKDHDEDFTSDEILAVQNALSNYETEHAEFVKTIHAFIEASLQQNANVLCSKTFLAIQQMI